MTENSVDAHPVPVTHTDTQGNRQIEEIESRKRVEHKVTEREREKLNRIAVFTLGQLDIFSGFSGYSG